MSAAVLFAGQAADDLRGALRGLIDDPPPLLAEAARLIDVPPARWLTGDHLDRSRCAQPIQVALGLTLYAADPPSDAVVFAGHSLGALTAATAAGALDPAMAVRIAVVRGRVMAEAAAQTPGGMVALRLDGPTLRTVLATHPTLALAARNGPEQVVLAGPHAAIDALLTEHPGRRLAVEGAWHHPAMASAIEPLRRALRGQLRAPRCPVLCGLDSELTTDPASIEAALVALLTEPVDWPATCAAMGRRAARVVIFGPGRALRGLMRANLPELPITLHAKPRPC